MDEDGDAQSQVYQFYMLRLQSPGAQATTPQSGMCWWFQGWFACPTAKATRLRARIISRGQSIALSPRQLVAAFNSYTQVKFDKRADRGNFSVIHTTPLHSRTGDERGQAKVQQRRALRRRHLWCHVRYPLAVKILKLEFIWRRHPGGT